MTDCLSAWFIIPVLFEDAGVLWQINLTNPTQKAITADLTFELGAMALELAHVAWVVSSQAQ